MDKRDIAENNLRYAKRLEKHGESVKALASGSLHHQQCRFNILKEIGNLNGCSVLDLGCGLADFNGFLIDNDISVDYTGIDIFPEFISAAQKKYPESLFLCADILEKNILNKEKFDYVICSQVFNKKLKYTDNITYVKRIIKKIFSLSKKGIAIDFISNYVDYMEDELFYYSPEEIFSYAKTLSKRVSLRHDYPLFEFCLYIYPDFKGWKEP